MKRSASTPVAILVSLAILLGAAGIAAVLFLTKPEAQQRAPERAVATVEVVRAEPSRVTLTVRSQGTVLPRTEADLAAEVSGRIVEVSPNFRAGGFFSAGEVLVRIDDADYRALVAARQAELAGAVVSLEQEKALAEQAAIDWQNLGEGDPTPLTLREPQLARARAAVDSARAALEKARRDLDRTEVRAPYDGRVLRKYADLGQYITAAPAGALARIYATDYAEVRLPITDREAGYIDLPFGDAEPARDDLPAVTLRASLGGRERSWEARIVRVEATVDTRSRLLYAVAEIADPFTGTGDGLPMQRGMFVNAEIEGLRLEDVYSIPRYALRDNDSVYVVTGGDTLSSRTVSVVRSDAGRAVVDGGLEPGDLVAISPVAYFVEGMPVTIPEPAR